MPKIIPLETTAGPLTTMDKLFDEVEAENARNFKDSILIQNTDPEAAQRLCDVVQSEMEKSRPGDSQRIVGFFPGETVVVGGPSKGKV